MTEQLLRGIRTNRARVAVMHITGVTVLVESRDRLYFEAVTRGLINPHLMREVDAAMRARVKNGSLSTARLYIDRDWLDKKNSNGRHIAGNQ